MKNMTNERPLTLYVWSRDRDDSGPPLRCEKNELSGPNLEYDCLPPVKGEFLLVKVPNGFNTTLVLCLVTVLGLGKSYIVLCHLLLTSILVFW